MLTLFIFKLAGMVTAAAVSTGAAISVWYLNRRWHLHLSEMELQQITACAQEAVAATEQHHKYAAQRSATDQQKLDFATRNLLEHLRRAGIKINRLAAESMIEAQINRLRNQDALPIEMPRTAKRDLAWTARDT